MAEVMMDELVPSQSEPRTAAEYQAALERLLIETDRIRKQMATDRSEIDRLRAESRTLRDETRAILANLGIAL
jgi:hypothetical protein